jgi:uncharacterized protein (TIGR02217 family)
MFIEQQINPGRIILDTSGGQSHNTSIITVASGREQRNANLAQSRGKWDLGERSLLKDEKDEIENHFNTCRGKLHGFRFKDWSNYEGTTADTYMKLKMGTMLDLAGQMCKQYSIDGQFYRKEIKKPVFGTVKVYKNGVEVPATQYSVDYTTGMISFGPALNNPNYKLGDEFTWSGEYDLPVRYDTDEIKIKFEGINPYDHNEQMFYLYALPIVELVL